MEILLLNQLSRTHLLDKQFCCGAALAWNHPKLERISNINNYQPNSNTIRGFSPGRQPEPSPPLCTWVFLLWPVNHGQCCWNKHSVSTRLQVTMDLPWVTADNRLAGRSISWSVTVPLAIPTLDHRRTNKIEPLVACKPGDITSAIPVSQTIIYWSRVSTGESWNRN